MRLKLFNPHTIICPFCGRKRVHKIGKMVWFACSGTIYEQGYNYYSWIFSCPTGNNVQCYCGDISQWWPFMHLNENKNSQEQEDDCKSISLKLPKAKIG